MSLPSPTERWGGGGLIRGAKLIKRGAKRSWRVGDGRYGTGSEPEVRLVFYHVSEKKKKKKKKKRENTSNWSILSLRASAKHKQNKFKDKQKGLY